MLLRIIPAWQNTRTSYFAKLPGSLYAIAPTLKSFFYSFFSQRYPPKQRTVIYFEYLFFNLFYAPLPIAIGIKQVQSRLAVRRAKHNNIFVEMMENLF
jgi:hypothetical protein